MDISEFRVIRPPVTENEGALALRESVPDPRRSPLVSGVADLPPITVNTIPPEGGSLDDDPLMRLTDIAQGSPLQRVYEHVNLSNDILRRHNDWLSGAALVKALNEGGSPLPADEVWQFAMAVAHVCYTTLIGRSVQSTDARSLIRATELTRRVLVADLLMAGPVELENLDEAALFDRLNRRPVMLPSHVSSAVAKSSRVQLIRDATVADLHVIRREWSCYQLGEVANIRNVMGGETFVQTQTVLREREVTTVTEAERQEQTEQEDSSKLASELSQEVNTQLNLSVNGYVDASVQYKTPVATINVAGGASVGLSMQRGERFASKVAREAVTRAVRRVDTRTRETRSQRELTRNEDVTKYELRNDGGNLSAVYRWVDRVDRYQLFRYPDRLQLEFQLPEPAEFYRRRTKETATAAAAVNKPPDTFDVTLEGIVPSQIVALATRFQASNLPAVPDEFISIAQTITLSLDKEALPSTNEEFNCPTQAKEIDIAIPNHYKAAQVTYSGHGFPMWGKWRFGSLTIAAGLEGFHSGFAAVSVGDQTRVDWVGGFRTDNGNLGYLTSYGNNQDKGSVQVVQWSDQPGEVPIRSVPYGRAMLVIGRDENGDLRPDAVTPIAFDPGIAVAVRVGLSTAGLAGCVVTFNVKCQRTDEAMMSWRLSVYDALFSAWSQWKREYAAAQLRQSLMGSSASDAGSSTRNEQIIREELKRQVISWLLDEEEFSGRPALRTDENDARFRSTSFTRATASAATIQFLEQAFEWGNMMYMFYPYYWASGGDWAQLSNIATNDPEFERFLRAGSARVVVPARPGFTDAVKNWLLFGVPFMTGQLPTPGDDLYVAIDREIRDLTSSWEGGIAEDSWEARVSTTLLYLQADATFPIKNEAAVLPVAKGEVYTPKPLCD